MSASPPPRQSPKGDSLSIRGARKATRRMPPGQSLSEIARRLTPRDRVIAFLLEDHTALTTGQLTQILFSSEATCSNRLYALRRLGFIARITRTGPGGRQQVLWVPGRLSSRLVALARDQTPPTPKAVALRQDTVLAGQTACHTVECNQFFVDLLAHGRAHLNRRLVRWWSARQAASAVGGRVHPDGHGVWETDTGSVGFWIEFDRGTEDHGRLRGKLEPYQRLRAAGGPAYPVLFNLPSRQREDNLHRHLTRAASTDARLVDALATVPVATCARDDPHGYHPALPIWRPVGADGARVSLSDLPADHGSLGPLEPGPPTAEQDPLFELHHTV